MKRKLHQSPYFWAVVVVVAVVSAAWMGRKSYQPVITGSAAPDFAALNMAGSSR